MMLVPLNSIIVVRDGKRITPALNAAFEFTKEEAEHLLAAGVARIAHSGDPAGTADPAMTGDLAMAASKRNQLTADDVAKAAAAAAAAAVAAAQTGQPTPEAAKAAGKATKASKKTEDDDL